MDMTDKEMAWEKKTGLLSSCTMWLITSRFGPHPCPFFFFALGELRQ